MTIIPDQAFISSYFAALMMGLFSSMHCIGMCGSIIGTLSLSLSQEIRSSKRRLLCFVFNYNLGRIISYALAGALTGIVGILFELSVGELTGYRILQLLASIVMTCAGFYLAGWFPHFAYVEKIGFFLWKKLEPCGRRLIPVKNLGQAYLFGMIWGWLPCGLVYATLALAVTAGSVYKSALTMLFFGIGTLPSVMGVGIMTGLFTKLSRMQRFKQLVGLFMIGLALFSAMPWLNPMAIVPVHSSH